MSTSFSSLTNEIRFAANVPYLARELHVQLQRYIEAQYPIRHPALVEERRALLETPGVISQIPFIETTPGYVSGAAYSDLKLSSSLCNAFTALASFSPSIIPPRLYKHQAEALQVFLQREQDMIVVTGTGSGKTETFLLPILARAIEEASTRSRSFAMPGMRTLLLYPMNALVNDQLTRLRNLFGSQQLTSWFRTSYQVHRPIRFGMYTSRTPYPGLLSKEKNTQQLIPLLKYYLQLEQTQMAQELKDRGRWPALDLNALYDAACEGKTHVGSDDHELYTRQQIQVWCPDILVTNYSMLEYMLMRPIERSIFEQTAAWLAQDRSNTLQIVLDEAHLYNGVTGAEISLLLRRLQARLGIDRSRVRYILTSASLDTGSTGQDAILQFGATLAGQRPHSQFAIIQGQRTQIPQTLTNTTFHQNASELEGMALSAFRLEAFTKRVLEPQSAKNALNMLAHQLHWPLLEDMKQLPYYLAEHLPSLKTFQMLWKVTSQHAQAFQELAQRLFPILHEQAQIDATSALLTLSATAMTRDDRAFLPIRAHLFFRGLPPVYACINPSCSARRSASKSSELGALWLSPRLHCTCGGRVYELYSHRNCGTLFLRAFASNDDANFYWHEPSNNNERETDVLETLLLVGTPHSKANAMEVLELYVKTGQAFIRKEPLVERNASGQNNDVILVRRPVRTAKGRQQKGRSKVVVNIQDEEGQDETLHWKSCPVCRKRLYESSLTSLSTKGEQPFVNLVRRQFELQPPSTFARDASPNEGRKVLLFSDGRQRAARLARDLPREVELDTFRQALLLATFQRSQRTHQPLVRMDSSLYRNFVAVCALYRLHFFDGNSQKELLRHIAEFREIYDSNIALAEEEDWEPSLPKGYHLALLRQVADRFYSMQHMCTAVIEPSPASMRSLRKKTLFAQLSEDALRALVVSWIEALLDVSAFDGRISPSDREGVVPGEGFVFGSTSAKANTWNDAEKAAATLFGYTENQLQQLRTAFINELCEEKDGRAFLRPEKLALRLTLEDSWYQCDDCTQVIFLPLGGKCPNPRCESTHLTHLPNDDPSLRARTDFYREPIREVIARKRSPMHITAEEHTAQLSYRDMQKTWATTEEYELRFQDIGIAEDKPSIDILSCTTTMEVGVDIGSLLSIGLRTMPPQRANYQQRAGRAGRRGSALSTVLAYSENGTHDAYYFAHPDEMIAGPLPCPQVSPVNQRLITRHLQAALIQTFFLEYVQKVSQVTNQYGYLAESLGKAKTFFASSESYGLNGFQRWLDKMLDEHNPQLAQHVIAWLPNSLSSISMDEQEKLQLVRGIAKEFLQQLQLVGEQQFFKKDTTQGSQSKQSELFGTGVEDITLLDLLFDHGFLPTYAFPREVRSFVIEEWKSGGRIGIKERPQQSVDIALSEYAPGRELIVDKVTYRVGGIYVDPAPSITLDTRVSSVFHQKCDSFTFCTRCSYIRRETNLSANTVVNICPLCHGDIVHREIFDAPNYTPEKAKPLQQSRVQNSSSGQSGIVTQVQLVLPPNDEDDFKYSTADGRVMWNHAEHRELLIANLGKRREGFFICRSCGAASLGDASWLHTAHDRPFLIPAWIPASRKCSSPEGIWQGYLGHTFHSDLLLLRFLWPDTLNYQVDQPWMRDALYTLSQALLLAATFLLDISTTELQVGWSYTIASSSHETGQLHSPRMVDFFLFDTLSGGAGFATQVGQHVDALLEYAQRILDNCPDQCEQSCYRCLRSYSNRILHPRLDRHLAGTLLQTIIDGKPPETATVAQQANQLHMLCQFLELSGNVRCYQKVQLHNVDVPVLVESEHGTYALGTYPIQQMHQMVGHPLDRLPKHQVQLFSDYELRHSLPAIAQQFLSH